MGEVDKEGPERSDDRKRAKPGEPEPAEAADSLRPEVSDIMDPTDLECSLCMR